MAGREAMRNADLRASPDEARFSVLREMWPALAQAHRGLDESRAHPHVRVRLWPGVAVLATWFNRAPRGVGGKVPWQCNRPELSSGARPCLD